MLFCVRPYVISHFITFNLIYSLKNNYNLLESYNTIVFFRNIPKDDKVPIKNNMDTIMRLRPIYKLSD